MSREEEVRQVLLDYLNAGLVDRNVEKVQSCISEDIMGFGMGEQGFVSSKEDVMRIMRTDIKQEENVQYELQCERPYIRFQSDTVASVCAQVIVRRVENEKSSLSGLMQSLTLRLTQGKWLITTLHASPIILSEESIDAYPLRYAENTLAHLRDELQKETFELMNRSISGGILSCYRSGEAPSLYFVNDSMLEYLAYSREEFVERFGGNVLNVVHPSDRALFAGLIGGQNSGGRDYEVRLRTLCSDGAVRWMVVRGRAGTDELGREVLVNVFMDVTGMVEMQERLEAQAVELEAQARELSISEERFRIALEKTSNIIFDYDIISGNIMHSSVPKRSMDFVTNINEARQTLIIGGTILEEYLYAFHQTFEAVSHGEPQAACTVKVRLATGKEVWNKISLTGITNAAGQTVRAIGMIEDITREKEAEIAYAREEQYRQAILADAMASYVINFSRGVFESCKISSEHCLTVMPGDPYDTVLLEETRSRFMDEDRLNFLNEFLSVPVMERYRRGITESSLEYRMLCENGRDIWMRTALHMVLDSVSNEYKGFMYVTDIDKRKREELELMRLSEQDSMTGLYNKSTAAARISELLKTYEGVQSGVFMMLDIDHFKSVNDQYGHPYGDQILTGVAKILRDSFRERDILGRLGGDEFCVCFCGMRTVERIKQSAREILEAVSALVDPATGKPPVTCSIGVTVSGGVQKTFSQVYQEADQALYQVKNQGRNGLAFYEEDVP